MCNSHWVWLEDPDQDVARLSEWYESEESAIIACLDMSDAGAATAATDCLDCLDLCFSQVQGGPAAACDLVSARKVPESVSMSLCPPKIQIRANIRPPDGEPPAERGGDFDKAVDLHMYTRLTAERSLGRVASTNRQQLCACLCAPRSRLGSRTGATTVTPALRQHRSRTSVPLRTRPACGRRRRGSSHGLERCALAIVSGMAIIFMVLLAASCRSARTDGDICCASRNTF